MRQKLIEALLYPRMMVEELIEEGNYVHKNLFEATGERCHHCDGGSECDWGHCLQDFKELDKRTTESLSASLREGIKLVEALHSKLRHDETTSTSEYCNWIRNAEHLVEEAEHHLPHVDPAPIAQSR